MGTARARTKAIHMLVIVAGMVWCAEDLRGQVDPGLIAPGDTTYEIRLADGSTLFASVTGVEGDMVLLTTAGGGRVEVSRAQIVEMSPAEGEVVSGEFWRADPNVSRLFFSPTGWTLDGGQAYFGTYFIVFPFVAVGVTDRLTIAAGAPVLLGEVEPFYVAPKLQIVRTESATFSIGALHFLLPDDYSDTDVGVAYGAGTFGSRNTSLTLGLGFGYAGSDFESQPVAMVGGEVRASRRAKLLAEGLFLPGETGAVLGAGFRFIGERFSADVGIGGAVGGGESFCCIPLANVSYFFGNGP